MPIDDPIDAVQGQVESEARAKDPILSRLAIWAANLRLPIAATTEQVLSITGFDAPIPIIAGKTLEWIIGRVDTHRLENVELLLSAVTDQVRCHENGIKELRDKPQQDINEWLGLVVDGIQRAERTRAQERVKRIGTILGSVILAAPSPSVDDTEEMMRVAMERSDRDVRFLGELVRVQGDMVRHHGRISRFEAWQSWPSGPWGDRLDSGLDSAFSKLENLGLVSRLAPPNNLNLSADFQNRYALLKKGLEFVRLVQSG